MGYHVVTITFYPLSYTPSSGTLTLYTNINFTIVYASNTISPIIANSQNIYSNNLAKGYLGKILANAGDIGTVAGGAKKVIGSSGKYSNLRGMNPTNLVQLPDYIIITNSAFSANFQTLANWNNFVR